MSPDILDKELAENGLKWWEKGGKMAHYTWIDQGPISRLCPQITPNFFIRIPQIKILYSFAPNLVEINLFGR